MPVKTVRVPLWQATARCKKNSTGRYEIFDGIDYIDTGVLIFQITFRSQELVCKYHLNSGYFIKKYQTNLSFQGELYKHIVINFSYGRKLQYVTLGRQSFSFQFFFIRKRMKLNFFATQKFYSYLSDIEARLKTVLKF